MMSLLSLLLTAFQINDLGSNTSKLRENEEIPTDLIFSGQKGETETLILIGALDRTTHLKRHALRRCDKFVTSGYFILHVMLHSHDFNICKIR